MATASRSQGQHPDRRLDGDGRASVDRVLSRILRAVREHLDLDVAFIGEIVGDERVLRFVDSDAVVETVVVGGRDPVGETYCGHVLAGRLPQYLPDPSVDPLARRLPVTAAVPVGSHLSVPIRLADGRVYGTFCAFALDVRESLRPDDLRAVEMAARLVADHLDDVVDAQRERQRRRTVIRSVLDDPGGIEMVFQPLRDVITMEVVAVEALARFPRTSYGPQWFFTEADELGLGIESEIRAVRLALAALPELPHPVRLNVNVSPETLCSDQLLEALEGVPPDRVMVEVTEHAAVDDYLGLHRASARLSRLSVRMAIDDVGTGFSGLNRMLETSPAELKLDAVMIRNVHTNPVKQALIEMFSVFGRRTGFDIVAEGVESGDELAMLRSLGIGIAQGYHLGRPGPLDQALQHRQRLRPTS